MSDVLAINLMFTDLLFLFSTFPLHSEGKQVIFHSHACLVIVRGVTDRG